MFRSKDRLLKHSRICKSQNANKDKNKYIKYGSNKGGLHSSFKAIQQYMINEYDICVHKNDISYLLCGNFINESSNTNKLYGNTDILTLRYVLKEIKNNNTIPYDWYHKHDLTRWLSSKSKCRQRNFDRDCKIANQTLLTFQI